MVGEVTMKVLHVDDSPDDLELTRIRLARLSDRLEIAWADSAKEALAQLASSKYDCVICDYQMPEMNGLELLAELRGQENDIPFIFLTGQGNEEIAAEALRSGADGYFTKHEGFAHHERLLHNIRRVVKAQRSARHKLELANELKESHRVFHTLMDNLPGMVYRCYIDDNWTMRFVSEGCFELTGYTSDALVDNNRISFADLILPDDRSDVNDDVRKAIVTEEQFTLTYRIVTASGELKWVRERGRPVHPDGGETMMLEGFIYDVTDRIRAEEALRISEERYRRAFHSCPVSLHINRFNNGEFVDVNSEFVAFTGYAKDDVLGRSSLEMKYWINPEDRALIVNLLQRQGWVKDRPVRIRTRGGEAKPGLLSASLADIGGEPHILYVFQSGESV